MINQVILIGHLGQDPEIGETQGGKLYVAGKLATREFEKDGAKRWVTEIVVQGPETTVRLLGDAVAGGVPPPAAEPDGRPWTTEDRA